MRPRRYVWFFAVLALCGTAAVTIPIVYNLHLQLKPEQLAEVRQSWRLNGPRDYDLSFHVLSGRDSEVLSGRDSESDEHQAIIRDGRVRWVVQPDGALASREQRDVLGAALGSSLPAWCGRGLSEEELQAWSVPGIFDKIAQGLAENAAAGGSNYATASFDPVDGHPIHYVRRVKATGERLELTIKLRRVEESSLGR
jgi:hypothetical protein